MSHLAVKEAFDVEVGQLGRHGTTDAPRRGS